MEYSLTVMGACDEFGGKGLNPYSNGILSDNL